MKEKLIAFFESRLHYMTVNPESDKLYFHQAFGALDFAMRLTDDWDAESELADLWNDEWKPKFEKQMDWGD